MLTNLKDINYLYPNKADFNYFLKQKAVEPFSELAIEFLNYLSKEISKIEEIRSFPDVATFGFFCRKANVISLRKNFMADNLVRLGRGIIFHISPSNVPVNFAYSLVCGILAGNINIVRVPSKSFRQIELIIDAIKNVSKNEKFLKITSKIILVRYDRNNAATKYLSSICDVRVIWGGDETISKIRENLLSPRAFDITFADRYSFCLINADIYIHTSNKEKIANDFYNDTYLFDQNACTAPHLVVWLGDKKNVVKSQDIFWEALHKILLLKKYDVQPVIAVDKLTAFYNQTMFGSNLSKSHNVDNLIWRVKLNDLDENIQNFRCSSGYFSEYYASSLFEISKIINRKYQTLSYFGLEKHQFSEYIKKETPSGIDRIVPIGRTSDFSLIWDGFSLINSLSRIIEIK
jgi:hypothetical protein